MAENSAWILGLGMTTPVGDCAAQTFSSVRAGISRYQESAVHNQRFTPMIMALLPEENLPPLIAGLESQVGLTSRERRMLRLGGSALAEADENTQALSLSDAPLFLALPEPLPEGTTEVDQGFLARLRQQSGVDFDIEASRTFSTGRCGGLLALAAALEWLEESSGEVAIVGGVDSYLDLALLGRLDQEQRVLAGGVMDGFAPGEAACFAVVTGDGRLAEEKSALAALTIPGLAEEEGHRYADEPLRGDGLGEAVSLAVEQLEEGERIKTVWASLNGENAGAKEWGVAYIRNSGAFQSDLRLEHPADCYGDIGAASGPVLVGLSAMELAADPDSGPALVWCASDGPDRGAVVVQA